MGDGGGGEAAGVDEGVGQSAAAPARRVATGQHPLAEEAERVANALGDKLTPAPARETPEQMGAAAIEPAPAVETARAPTVDGAGVAREVGARGKAEPLARGAGVLGRAAGALPRAGESLRPGVDRLRGTLVAFDEASSDDPGLRFVVVAAVLFLIFLLLWLFGYVLG